MGRKRKRKNKKSKKTDKPEPEVKEVKTDKPEPEVKEEIKQEPEKKSKEKVAEFESKIGFREAQLVNRAVYDESKLQAQIRKAGIKQNKIIDVKSIRYMDKKGGFYVTKYRVTYVD